MVISRQTNEEVICYKLAELFAGKNIHCRTKAELELIQCLEQAGYLSEPKVYIVGSVLRDEIKPETED